VAELDDESSIENIFSAHARDIAGVIIEPVPANYGLLPQREEFIRFVAQLCRESGALLIFDEVITGFRLGLSGFAGHSGIHPDIVTWGKIIGGGFPVGAFAAKREIMDLIAPAGPVYQAGTLSANPVAMTAGLVTLRKLVDTDVYRQLADLGSYLKKQLESISDLRVQQLGSLFWLVPGGAHADGAIRSRLSIPAGIEGRFSRLFGHALEDGLYLPPSPFECGFLSTAHTPEHVDRLRDSLLRQT
ncbi:MAG: aminotransferase class III-fold pyridoxal phosphate-dependent enzyme, partial [Gammaproteobacteria bacterium]|nr:aminotransferase class III-fold pyridoxal phosphate-dependent enzyme [Gammaproteobacteria bacterium]